ncbi:lanthionine synthetase-like protein [Thermosporothrix hazakensis]|uniref:Lanthionine synthetase-like protein n=2 Tax=Thermosporothrix hazakensis TaxID=644383 RepID=A0A326UC15_THEHA|nr:lanthionine synthetase C family protein [Thermosporothrix hazakensis]PZW34219.1 lanthionine synthetase-like protein [Thermosporothrix hazakensis]GCE46232.1 hypothetical protein KTH_11010 [Thermosporothrix hazakensis]
MTEMPTFPVASTLLTESRWKSEPLLHSSMRQKTLDVVHELAERLQEREKVQEALLKRSTQKAPSLAWGLSGISLTAYTLFSIFQESQWLELAHRYFSQAVACTRHEPLSSSGLCDGTAGLAFTISTLYDVEPRYARTVQRVQEKLLLQVQERTWKRDTFGVAEADYDIVRGAAGILAYLVSVPNPSEQLIEIINKLLEYLIWLAEPSDLPRWSITPPFFTADPSTYRDTFAQGYINCGYAHGIAGPLTALSLAWAAGFRRPGQQEAMNHLAQWLLAYHCRDTWGMNWPVALPLSEISAFDPGSIEKPARAAWCYGAPGIARALWLTGIALEDNHLQTFARDAMDTALHRPPSHRFISAPILCHGISGLLLLGSCFVAEGAMLSQTQALLQLTQHLLDTFQPELPFAYQNIDRDGNTYDDPSLLTGMSGILLTLLTVATGQFPSWARAFLIV